ncbi:hypothetical protein ABK905_03035 [Acerihabitans sp. KWT182]|uniref:Uncharacterized protein n=1 Tax=Acerihabitans sp. KWT182 TaxID=3157919 RepID=A0AAU7QBI9_9GAMM
MQITGNSQQDASQATQSSVMDDIENLSHFLNRTLTDARNDANGGPFTSSSSGWSNVSSSAFSTPPSSPPPGRSSSPDVNGDTIANGGNFYQAEEIGDINSTKFFEGNPEIRPDLKKILEDAKGCKGNLVANSGDYVKAKKMGNLSMTSYHMSPGGNSTKRLNEILELAKSVKGAVYANGGDVIEAETVESLTISSNLFSTRQTKNNPLKHDGGSNSTYNIAGHTKKNEAGSAKGNETFVNKRSSTALNTAANLNPRMDHSTLTPSTASDAKAGPYSGVGGGSRTSREIKTVFGGQGGCIIADKISGGTRSRENIEGVVSHRVHRDARTGAIMSSLGTVTRYVDGKPV